MTAPISRPRLSSKVRLRVDRHSGQSMLLYPEKGMALNETAAAVAALCTGAHGVDAIVDALCARFSATPREQIEREALAFLHALAERGLIEEAE